MAWLKTAGRACQSLTWQVLTKHSSHICSQNCWTNSCKIWMKIRLEMLLITTLVLNIGDLVVQE